MSSESGETHDVKDFHFKQMRKLRIGNQPTDVEIRAVSLLAVSNTFGLTFVGFSNGVQVFETALIEQYNDKESVKVDLEDFECMTIAVNSTPTHVSLSCDDLTLVVCCEEGNSVILKFFDVRHFNNRGNSLQAFLEYELCAVESGRVYAFAWNNGIPNSFAIGLTNGSALELEINNKCIKQLGNLHPVTSDSNEFDKTATSALCWSPKGKQLVVGKRDGSLTQYKSSFHETKSIPGPDFFETHRAVLSVLWISNLQFIVTYYDPKNHGVQPCVVIVETPKSGPIRYISFEDVCFASSSARNPFYFLHYFSQWNILFCLSNNACETAVLHLTQSNENIWKQWFLEDSGRAELPLIKHSETYAYGIALDLTAQKDIKVSDTQVLPPQPIFLVLSSSGLLCPFQVIYDPMVNVSVVNAPSKISTGQLQEDPSQLHLLENKKQCEEINSTVVRNPTLFFTAAIPDKTSQHIAEPKFPPAGVTTGMTTTAFTSSILPVNSLVNQQTSGLVSSNQGIEAGFQIKTLESQAKASSKRIHQTNLASFPSQTRFSNKPLPLSSSISRNVSTTSSRPVSSVPDVFNSNQLKTSRVYTRKSPCQASASYIHEILASDQKNASRDTFTSSILEEAAAFQKELNDLRSRNSNLNYEVGTKEEMITLKKKTESMQQFIEELKETIVAQNNEIHELKMMTIGTFQVVEEGCARQQLQQDPNYLQLLRQRGLDPVSTRKMKEIRKSSQYLDNWMREVNHRLDMEWEEYERRRKNILWKGPSSLDLIYNTLCNNQNIIVDQGQRLDELCHELQQLHLRVTPKWQHQNLELSFNKGDTQLSSLAESLIEQDTNALKTPSPAKFLSPEKQANLRALLEKRQTTPVRTANVSILNVSKSPHHLESLEISDVENEIDDEDDDDEEEEDEEDIEDDDDLEEEEENSEEENFEKYMTKEEMLHTSFPGNQGASSKQQTIFGQPIHKPFGNLNETDVQFQTSTRKPIVQPSSPLLSPDAHISSIQTFSSIPSAITIKNKVSSSFNSITTATDTSVVSSQPLTKPLPASTSNTVLTSTSGITTASSAKPQSVFSFNVSKPVSNFTFTLPTTTAVTTSSTTSAAPFFKLPSTSGTITNTFQFKMPDNLSQPKTSSAFSFPGFSFKNNSELLDKTQPKEESSVPSFSEVRLSGPSPNSVSFVSSAADTPVLSVSSTSLNANVSFAATSDNVNHFTDSITTIAPSITSASSSVNSTVTSVCVSPNVITAESASIDKVYTIEEINVKPLSETTAQLTVNDNTESNNVASSENVQTIPVDLIQPISNASLPAVDLTLNINEASNLAPLQEETINKPLFESVTPTASPTNAAVFGSQSSINPTSGSPATSTGFNQTVDSISNIFGQSTTLFSPPVTSTATSAFGQSPTSIVSPLFSQSTTSVTPVFGQTTTSVAPVFGQSTSTVFRQPTQNIFGQPTSTSVFNPASTTTSASVFSQPIAASTTTTSLFAPAATTTSSSIFGQSSANSGFGFGSQAVFGQSPASTFKFTTQSSPTPSTTTFGFGQQTTASTFGSFGQSGSSVFGQNAVFGQTQTSPSGSNVFGQPFFGGLGSKPSQENASKNVFGGSATFGTSSPSGFLSTTFGGSPVFGSTPLGFSGSTPAPVFGSTMNQNTAFSSLAANTNSTPTFGSLASQGSPTFGNLANSSPPSFNTPPQATAFGSPSFGTSTFGVTPGFGSPQQPSTTSFSQWR